MTGPATENGCGRRRGGALPRIGGALAWLGLLAVLVIGAGEGARSGRLLQAQGATPAAPSGGAWAALHAPRKAPLWTSGGTQRSRPCGVEDREGGERRGLVPPLCGVHLTRQGDGALIGWAVGEEGLLARYADGAWRRVDDLDPRKTSPKTYHLNDVFVAAADDVWAVGWAEGDRGCADCGVILHFDGKAWRQLDKFEFGINSCVPALNAIDLYKGPDGRWFGWIMGDEKSCLNGGAVVIGFDGEAWKWFRAPQLSINMHDIRIVSPDEAWAVGELGSESYFDARGGKTGDWPLQGRSGAHNLFAVDLVDPTYGWDGGIIGRLNRYDGNCHDDDPVTPCWFDNQANPIKNRAGNKVTNSVYAIDLLTRTQGWLVGAEDGRISMVARFFEDGGANPRWETVPVTDDPGKTLFGLSMVDASHGFAVGDEGVILEYTGDSAPTETASPSPSSTGTPTPTATLSPTSDPPTPPPTPTIDETATLSPTATRASTLSPTPEPTPHTPTATTGTPTTIPTEATPTRGTPTATGTRRTPTATRPFLPIKRYVPFTIQVRPRR